MRVLHVYKTYLPDNFQGIPRAIWEIAEGTLPLGVRSEVLSLSANPQPESVTVDHHVSRRVRQDLFIASTGLSLSVFARFRELARGADVLVSSILDLDAAVATIRASRPQAPPAFFEAARDHFSQHHLSPEAAGRLAQAAGVKRVVFTHIGITPARMKAARAQLARTWRGPVVFARDLGAY